MNGVRLTCSTCQRTWALGNHVNIYERQVLESRPCHYCGANTLRCENAPKLLRFANRKLQTAES